MGVIMKLFKLLSLLFFFAINAAQQKSDILHVPYNKKSVFSFLINYIDTAFEGDGLTKEIDELVSQQKHIQVLKAIRSEKDSHKKLNWLRKYANKYATYAFELSRALVLNNSKEDCKEALYWYFAANYMIQEDLMYHANREDLNFGKKILQILYFEYFKESQFFDTFFSNTSIHNQVYSSLSHDLTDENLKIFPGSYDPEWIGYLITNSKKNFKVDHETVQSLGKCPDNLLKLLKARKVYANLNILALVSKSTEITISFDERPNYKCANCPKLSESFSVCGKCKSVYYCSIKCQRADWQRHKITCKSK
jgi:hypothetical protein